MNCYFYENTKRGRKFIVYEVKVFNNNIDEAERKARTIAKKRKKSLAGGFFVEEAKPYNFIDEYKVIKVSQKTKISPYSIRDLYIQKLIEREQNLAFTIL